MELPSELPTITTISKVEDLKNQAFFVNTEIGDKVLIYIATKKVVIYRPSTHKIINSGPILK
jgi:hypothetical protein